MHEVARRLPELTGRDDIEEALDKLEYLFEVIPPELQDAAGETPAMRISPLTG